MKLHGAYVNTRRLVATTALFIGLFPVSAVANPVPRPSPVSGQVVSVKSGEDIVFVKETDRRNVAVKQDLKAGDVIKTNSEGALSIVFADRTQIRLARNTTLLVKEVAAGSPSEIEMKSGSLWARAPRGKSKLTVRTPSATAAIRGTEWSLTVADDVTDLQVAEGEVEISNPEGRLNVSAGEAARANLGRAPVKVVVVSQGSREQMLYYLSPDFIPADIDPNSDLGRAYDAAYLGEMEAAEKIIDKILREAAPPENVYWLGTKIGFLRGNKDRISRTLTQGLTAYPDSPALLALQAEFKAAFLGRPDLALVDARQAVERAPEYAPGLLILSKVLLERQRDLEALEIVNRLIANSPENVEAYVHKADIFLKQNRPHAAQNMLAEAFALSPDLTIARLGRGHVAHLHGDDETALTEILAASAGNPSYSLAILKLAEIYGHSGQTTLAEQQLDAADRLDPNTPFTPLYRTTLALHNYESGKAIDGAQDALERFQARGGLYENLSENRETGSNISRAFRFLGLEAWGRYYGDRVFDTFTATSYFDQTLNETPGPFFIRREDTSFNPQNGDDLEQVSSYLQGVTIDPLSVAESERTLQISQDEFTEGALGIDTISANTTNLIRQQGTFNGRFHVKRGQDDLPVAFSLTGVRETIDDNVLDQNESRNRLETYVGAELSPRDSLVLFGTYRTRSDRARESLNVFIERERELDFEDILGFGFLTHRFADFNQATLGIGHGQFKSEVNFTRNGPGNLVENNLSVTRTKYKYLSAQYARRWNKLDVKIGGEGYWLDHVDDPVLNFLTDPNGQRSNVTVFQPGDRTESHDIRYYVDGRYKLRENILLQGQLSLLDEYTTANAFPVGNPRQRTSMNYHIGGAYEPKQGHWFRVAATKVNQTNLPFTMAPINTLGLKGSLAPVLVMSSVESQIARWDAEWTDRLFTALEYQHQVMGTLLYETPDGEQTVFVGGSELNQYAARVNYLLGGNWALATDITHVKSQRRDLTGGRPVPFVPKTTARASLTWTHPKRISATLSAKYVGTQEDSILVTIDDGYTLDLTGRWEPWGKRIQFRAGILNLLDNDRQVTIGIPAPGQTVFVSAKARF